MLMWLDKIREMKEASGLTTNQISEQSQIPEPTLEKLFAGTTKDPKLGTIRELVYFLGYTLDDLEEPSIKQKNPPSEVEGDIDDIKELNAIYASLNSSGRTQLMAQARQIANYGDYQATPRQSKRA